MKKHKRARYQSPTGDKTDENEVNSFDSGVDISNAGLDESQFSDSLAGKLETLHMVNFMCHSNLEVTFNKRITFVTGRNGSGKSTIMAALIVALGGAATTTGRGNGITDFIKKGESWAKVSITLINDGINSYKKNIYGNRITIIRSISKCTTGSYVCKSEFNEVISKKKEDVDKIISALDLQIKNPICILNQDVARSFLSATDKNLRYSMFMKATHLENLKAIYFEAVDLLQESQKELEAKKSGITTAGKEINQLKEKLEYFASLEKYVNERTSLENEYLWSLVISEETTLNALIEKRQTIEERKESYHKSEDEFQCVISKLESIIKETQEEILKLGNNKGQDKVKKKDLQNDVQNLVRQMNSANSQLKHQMLKRDRHLSDINSIKEHLKQSEEIATQSQAEKVRIEEKMKALKAELSELHDRLDAAQRDTDNALETKLQHTMALENLKSDLKDLERSKRVLESQMERTLSIGQNILLKYGPFTPKLRELIDDAAKRNQFLKKPIGPCGYYVTLAADNKWARAVESVVGRLMGIYCCDNQKDFHVLNRLMDKVCGGKNPPIIVSKFQKARHNIESRRVSVRGLNAIVDVLDFSSDIVFNTFIDQAGIETILLFETDAQAASLLTYTQNVPKNLRMGYTVQNDQYYPAPNYRTYHGDRNRPLKYFDTAIKTKSTKEKFQEELMRSQLTIKEKNMEIAEMTRKLMMVTEFLRKTESNLKLLKQNERKIEAQIKQLKDEEESRPVLPTRMVLEEELSILERNHKEIQEEIEQEKSNLELLRSKLEEKTRELESITQSEDNVCQGISQLQEKLQESKYNLSLEKEKCKHLNDKTKEVQLELNQVMEEICSKKKSLASKLKAATEIHENRIDTERSPVEIQKLLEKCEKYLMAAEKKLDSKEIVINEYKMKHQKYKEMKGTVDRLERVVVSLSHVAFAKRERFKLLQGHTANLVSFHFQACMQTRGYDGQLKFDFQKQTLEIEVVPKDGLARKDTKTLSGGERSYSTVSYILAIWRAVQMPFYFLDEFDVFMDKVNRKVIMDLLLEHAKSQTKMQFIFITPQDISSIQASDLVSIYRMPDPQK